MFVSDNGVLPEEPFDMRDLVQSALTPIQAIGLSLENDPRTRTRSNSGIHRLLDGRPVITRSIASCPKSGDWKILGISGTADQQDSEERENVFHGCVVFWQ